MEDMYNLGTDISKGITVSSLMMELSVHAAATACLGTSLTNICPGRKGNVAPERERETLHLFQPPRADQMPDPLQGQD